MIACSIYASIRLVLCYTYITCTLYCLRPPRLCTHLPRYLPTIFARLVSFFFLPLRLLLLPWLHPSCLKMLGTPPAALYFGDGMRDDGLGTNKEGRMYLSVCLHTCGVGRGSDGWKGPVLCYLCLGFFFASPQLLPCIGLYICMWHCINMAWAFASWLLLRDRRLCWLEAALVPRAQIALGWLGLSLALSA